MAILIPQGLSSRVSAANGMYRRRSFAKRELMLSPVGKGKSLISTEGKSMTDQRRSDGLVRTGKAKSELGRSPRLAPGEFFNSGGDLQVNERSIDELCINTILYFVHGCCAAGQFRSSGNPDGDGSGSLHPLAELPAF